MTVLVTGGAGYIGSHMVHDLVDAGESVTVLDNLSTGFRFLIPASVHFVAGSTGDRPLVGEIIARQNVTAIIHFAASSRCARFRRRPARILQQQHHEHVRLA